MKNIYIFSLHLVCVYEYHVWLLTKQDYVQWQLSCAPQYLTTRRQAFISHWCGVLCSHIYILVFVRLNLSVWYQSLASQVFISLWNIWGSQADTPAYTQISQRHFSGFTGAIKAAYESVSLGKTTLFQQAFTQPVTA